MIDIVDIIVIGVLALLVGAAVLYIVKTKKKGRCIGCPDSATCDGGCASCSAARKKSEKK
jgi:hypothetical protein